MGGWGHAERGRPVGTAVARVLAATCGLALALSPGRGHAWRVFLTSRGSEVHWDGAAHPYVLQPGWPIAGGDAAVAEAMSSALAPWAETGCGVPLLRFGGIDAEAQLDDADLRGSVVWIDSASSWNARFGATELARTLVAFRVGSGAILDTDVAVNLGGHAFTVSDACPAGLDRYDLTSVLTHELGHALGLDHSDLPDATMFPKTEEGHCALRTLAEDDLAGLCHLYPPPSEAGPEPGPELPPEPATAEGAREGDDAWEGDGAGEDVEVPDALAEAADLPEAVERPPVETSLGCGGAAPLPGACLALFAGAVLRWLARRDRQDGAT